MFAEMRTGSNFLEANLNAMPGLHCHGEVFNPHFIGKKDQTEYLGVDLATRDGDPMILLLGVVGADDGRRGQREVGQRCAREAVAGAQVVIDLANSPLFEDKAVLEFFETSGRNLLAAEAAAGVRHHVARQIVRGERDLARVAAHDSGDRTNAPLVCYMLGRALVEGGDLAVLARSAAGSSRSRAKRCRRASASTGAVRRSRRNARRAPPAARSAWRW